MNGYDSGFEDETSYSSNKDDCSEFMGETERQVASVSGWRLLAIPLVAAKRGIWRLTGGSICFSFHSFYSHVRGAIRDRGLWVMPGEAG